MKKGFTMIELLVSIILLSIVIVFMTSFIINLKNQKSSTDINLRLMVNQAAISKAINYDVASLGINSILCESSMKCSIIFLDSTSKTIEITNNGFSIKYYSDTEITLIRTLTNYTFSGMTTNSEVLDYGTFYKIIIGITDDEKYNIEVFDYVGE